MIEKDTALLVKVKPSGGKTLSNLSQLACDVCQGDGVPELSLDDHAIKQLVKAGLLS